MIVIPARFRLLLEVLVVCLLFGEAIIAQIRFDNVQQEYFDLHAPVHRFAMPAPVVRHLAFGFENVLADYYWITALQDLNKWDRRDAYYPEYFRIISNLDARFEYPYMFAILTVPSRRNPDTLSWLAEIAQKGMETFPENWQIPFYVGVQYHVVGKSYEQAAHYLEIAAAKKASPEVVHTTYGIYLMHDKSEHERSRALFSTIADTTDNETTKQLAKERIALLDVIQTLEQAVEKYKLKYKVYPASLSDLVEKHFVELPPDLVKKFPLRIDQSTGSVLLER
jgi:tetratricopeptide (TPR) repeat protein